ncbi:MAG: efflux RND transporter periplasmic adaptor subunit [Pseudomonadota bacterium]
MGDMSATRLRTDAPLGALVVLGLFLAGCDGENETSIATTQIPVRAYTVVPEIDQSGLTFTAELQAKDTVELSFQVNGYVESLAEASDADRAILAGDRIAEGDTLASIDPRDYELAVSQAQASLSAAQATFEQAGRDLERYQGMLEANAVSEAEFESVRESYQTAQADVDSATADLNEAEIDLSYVDLTAPVSGILLERDIDVGALVRDGTVAFTLADDSEVDAALLVTDTIVQSLRIGQPLSIRVPSLDGQTFMGSVTEIAPGSDDNDSEGMFLVKVRTDNTTRQLQIGMTATVEIAPADTDRTILTIPLTSVVRAADPGATYAVYTLSEVSGDASDAAVATQSAVDLGEVIGNQIEVTGGLTAGDRIVRSGAKIVSNGAAVTIIP